ncbi:MAG: transposase [Deltaproteobacteria bacterium]|nr:transposase [Deltaproteobacteria bacterium]
MSDLITHRPPTTLFVSDGLFSYGVALLDRYHVIVTYSPTGKRGRPRCPEKRLIPELRYARVVKKRDGRRLVSVSRRIVYGDAQSISSKDINTSLVERLNLILRRENSTLKRKALFFAKDEGEFKAHLALQIAYYHFVRPHLSLREEIPAQSEQKPVCKWRKRTPAMCAKITDHVWSLRELLTFRPYITSTNYRVSTRVFLDKVFLHL